MTSLLLFPELADEIPADRHRWWRTLAQGEVRIPAVTCECGSEPVVIAFDGHRKQHLCGPCTNTMGVFAWSASSAAPPARAGGS